MSSKIRPHQLFEIYIDDRGRKLFTKSILPGKSHFEERLVHQGGEEFREFDPSRSKLGAMIAQGCTNIGLRKNDVVLYLGASHGYTPSFVSDIVGEEGLIFALDFAPRVLRDLVFLSQERKNLVPLLANAHFPEEYSSRICQVDVVYQDVAQRNQEEIFSNNCEIFLKKGGYGLLAVKARSIDIKRRSKDIFLEIRTKLEKKFTVIDYKVLEPFQKDHCMIIIKK